MRSPVTLVPLSLFSIVTLSSSKGACSFFVDFTLTKGSLSKQRSKARILPNNELLQQVSLNNVFKETMLKQV